MGRCYWLMLIYDDSAATLNDKAFFSNLLPRDEGTTDS